MGTEVLRPLYQPRKYLSISTLMDFVRCPRRYFYRKCGLAPKAEATALHYGTAMHAAVPVVVTEGLVAGYAEFLRIWQSASATPDDKRNPMRAHAQLSHFAHTHAQGRSIYVFEKPPPSDVPLGEDVSPWEVPAIVDLGLEVPLVARLDGLVRHRDTGELWGWEFKTTSRLSASLFENLELHPQILAESMILQTVLGTPVAGVMAEAMLVDKVKVDNLCHPIPVKPHLVADITKWLRFYGGLLLECERRDDPLGFLGESFPKNFASCSAYSFFYMPSFICDYANLCRHSADWRDHADLYDVHPEHEFIKATVKGEPA